MSQHKVSVQTLEFPHEIHALANRLGGICATEVISDRGITTSFAFELKTVAQQFIRAAHWYSEVEAIANV